MCGARFVSGPFKLIGASLVVHFVLLTTTLIWSGVCLPFLVDPPEDADFPYPEPTTLSLFFDFLLLALSVSTQLFAIKAQFTDPGIINRNPEAAAA